MPSSDSPDTSSENTSGENVSRGDASVEEDPPEEQVAETVECPNCEREFSGTYCPDCGQEADPTPSATGVIGGFFRELVDVEDGFWPTFVGLTLRPGETLRSYLSGVRAGLVGPGRYLLAAVVILFGIKQGFTWLGLFQSPEASFTATIPEEASGEGQRAMEAFFEVSGQIAQSQWGAVATTVILAGLLSLLFWRLFEGQVHRWSEALAISAFTVGHWTALEAGLLPLVVVFEYLTGEMPLGMLKYTTFSYLLALLYLGAVGGTLGSGWKDAAKGALSGAWAFIEIGAVFGVSTAGYFLWQMRLPGGTLGVIAALYSVPLLLHAAVELYYRLR